MSEAKRGRTKGFFVRLYDEEMNILEHKANAAGKSKSDYIRDFILFSEVKIRPIWQDANFKHLIYELNRIGNNINQLAYNSNLTKSTGREEIQGLKEQYEALLSLYEDSYIYPDPDNEVENGNNEES